MPTLRPASSLATTRLEARLAPAAFIVSALGDLGSGVGNSGDLRYCLAAANDEIANPGADTITFSALFNSAQTIVLLNQLEATAPVSIVGPGVGVTFDANKTGRVMNVDGDGSFAVSLTNLTLTNGLVSGSTDADRGGALRIDDETVTLTNCTVTMSSAESEGGGIATISDQAQLTLINSAVSNNASTGTPAFHVGSGGGIALSQPSSLTLQRSTVTGNTATNAGGGIYFYIGGTGSIQNSTIDNNKSLATNTNGGGGIYFYGKYGSLTVQNSTVSSNSSASIGGGITLAAFDVASFTLQNSTVTANTANAGGGISRATGSKGITLSSSIIAGNSGTAGELLFNAATNVAGNNNLIGIADVGSFTLTGTGNKTGTAATPLDAKLGTLTLNGGPTRTHLPLASSPTIDAGNNAAGFISDQRGTGFARLLGNNADIGAVEIASAIPNGVASTADVTTSGGAVYQFTVTYTDTNAINVASLDTGDVTVTGSNGFSVTPAYKGVNLNTNGSPRVATYVFTPPGGTWNGTDLGVYSIHQVANQVFDTDGTPLSAPAIEIGSFKVTFATSFVVDLAADENDGNFTAGDLSLREALFLANQNSPATDAITFAANVSSIALTLGELSVTDSVVIAGGGASKVSVSGSKLSRIVNVSIGSAGTLTLSGITLTDGSDANRGGAIFVAGGSSLALVDAVVKNSTAAGPGGGIFLSGNASLIVQRSAITGNSGGSGGGIYFQANGSLTVDSSTISGNTSTGGSGGGGIYFYGIASTPITIRNSTISGNSSDTDGGGFRLRDFQGAISFENSTITNNSSQGEGGGFAHDGTGSIAFVSSIIAANSSATSPDVFFASPTSVAGNNNLIGEYDSAVFTLIGGGNLTGTVLLPLNPQLEALANNGGPTFTHKLKAGSPAIDAGNNNAGLPFDQRGPGFNRDNGSKTDIGAFESASVAPPTATIKVNNGANQRSLVTNIVVTFSEPVVFANTAALAIGLQRLATSSTVNPNGPVTLAFNPTTGPATSVTITFNDSTYAPGGSKSLIDGRYSFLLTGNQIKSAASGQFLDGNGDGTTGDNQSVNLHRLFGDSDGDADVDNTDFTAFRMAFGAGASAIFDSDGDGDVDNADFTAFRQRFGAAP